MSRNSDSLLIEKRKQAILDLLDDEELPTSKIAILLNDNYYRIDIFLRQLEKDGKVEGIKKGRATYWKTA